MDSYQASLRLSRQTTGLSFVTSICIHALLLCALLLSYHVQSLLLTRQLKQAVPTAQGLDKSTHVIFRPLQNAQAQPSLLQNQSTTQNNLINPAISNNTSASADRVPSATISTPQDQSTQTPQTTFISKTDATQTAQSVTSQADDQPVQAKTAENPTTSIVSTDATLELPLLQHADSIPIQRASDTNLVRSNQTSGARSSSTRAYQATRTPWYKTVSTASNYAQASATQSVQKITLQDVTRGFFKSVQQEKRMATQSHNQLSTHDMVSKSYETKVYNMLQKSVLVEAKPINMHRALSTVAEVALTLDRTGKIVSFEFNHPLPKKDLKPVEDQLRRAAYSTGLYPSFPRIFTQNTYRFSLPLHIEITKGQHSYRLTTNYRPL